MNVSSEYTVALMISFGTLGMLLLAGGIVFFVVLYQKRMIQEQLKLKFLEADHQEKMMHAELESQENERRRLAADLHDSIGGMLSAIRVGLSTLGKQVSDGSIDETKQMLDETISSVRRISRDLMPSTLERFGLNHALKEMCERFSSTSQLPIHFEEYGEATGLEKTKELMLFRMTQEIINNAIKHSLATQLLITITVKDNLTIIAEDDGIGFNFEEQQNSGRKGLGLYSIQNRSSLLGASVEYEKERKKGTRVTITLPLLPQ